MKTVAILGCGPAGLLAAHAAHLARVDFRIYSMPIKSHIGGAQYLHCPIPHLTGASPDGVIDIFKFGNSRGYAKKVYGSEDAECSFDKFSEGETPAWSLRSAYDTLWEMYKDEIMPAHLEPTSVLELTRAFDLVISSIPAKSLCYQHHVFESQAVYFTDSAVFSGEGSNFIYYSGQQENGWYRTSSIFGVGQTEWPANMQPTRVEVREGIKPISTNCTCLKDVVRIGRFGQWKKGVLTHHAFLEVVSALQRL